MSLCFQAIWQHHAVPSDGLANPIGESGIILQLF